MSPIKIEEETFLKIKDKFNRVGVVNCLTPTVITFTQDDFGMRIEYDNIDKNYVAGFTEVTQINNFDFHHKVSQLLMMERFIDVFSHHMGVMVIKR